MSLKSPPPGDSDEISVVIKALREADLRLEELTSGEVDTVSDRDGRSFLLQHAQDQLRETEAAKQAAILNALPAYIAVLDVAGRVLSVNEMWGRLTAGNPLHGPAYGVGNNYLDMCDRVRGPESPHAHRAAAGMRSVLAGARKYFSMEYPCDLPTERRWFLLTTTPLATDHPRGAVIMHVDITDQKRSEAALGRFAAAMDATADALFLVDRSSMRYIHVNEAACRMQAQTRAALLASSPAQLLGVSERELAETYDRLIESGVDAKPVEVLRHRSDGTNLWVELRGHAQASGDSWTIVSIMRDDVRVSIGSLRAIRALGVRIAIDDFGTGFSSLSYLARLPVPTLKIDRSFVIDMGEGPEGLALVSTIIILAHSMKLNVVAEGVETEEQSRLLRLLNCDEIQGYLFSRPLARDAFEAKYVGAAALSQ
jgi:PAS domain S-box-containing protein